LSSHISNCGQLKSEVALRQYMTLVIGSSNICRMASSCGFYRSCWVWSLGFADGT